jgi:hypothetical protein
MSKYFNEFEYIKDADDEDWVSMRIRNERQ